MKKLTLYYLLLLLVCISCEQTKILPVLTQAEKLLEIKPDSSLLPLESIEHPEKMSKLDYATWCLLVTQARDKNYVEHISDSVINVAVKYFTRTEKLKKIAQSFYLRGRIMQDLSQEKEAIKDFLAALANGEQTEEYKLCGLLCSRIGQIYRLQFAEKQALPYYIQSFHYFEQAADTLGCAYALQGIGRLYTEQEPAFPDSSLLYYKKAYELINTSNYLTLQSSLLNDMGREYGILKDFSSALKCVKQAIDLSPQTEQLLSPMYLNIGDLYLQTARNDSARYYLQKSMQSSNLYTKSGSFSVFSELEAANGRYKEAYAYQDSFLFYNDSIKAINYCTQLLDIKKKLNNEKEIMQIHAEELSKQIILILSGSIIIILLLITIGIYQRRQRQKEQALRRKEQEISHLSTLIKNYEEEKRGYTCQVELLKQDNCDLHKQNEQLKQMEEILDGNKSIQEKIEHLQTITLNQSEIYRQIAPYRKKLRRDKADNNMQFETVQWEEFVHAVDIAYSKFLTHLKEQKSLNLDELIVTALIKLEINPTHMQIVLNIDNPSLITRKRNHLAEKLHLKLSELDKFISTC